MLGTHLVPGIGEKPEPLCVGHLYFLKTPVPEFGVQWVASSCICHNVERLPYEVTPSSYKSINSYFGGCRRAHFWDLGKQEKTIGLWFPAFATQKANNSPYRATDEGKTEEISQQILNCKGWIENHSAHLKPFPRFRAAS